VKNQVLSAWIAGAKKEQGCSETVFYTKFSSVFSLSVGDHTSHFQSDP